MSKLKKMLWIILIISVVILITYLAISWLSYEKVIEKEKFWEYFKKWGVIGVLGVIGAIFITYIVINKIIDRKKDSKEGLGLIKEFVDSDPAIKAWIGAFIINTHVPAYIDYSSNKEGEIKAKNDAVDVTTTKKFSHDITGVSRIEFEAVAKAGIRKGINYVIIPLDEGIEKIKANWNSYIQPHTTIEMHKHSNRYTPIATAQDENMRLQYAVLKDGDGISKEDVEQLEKFKVKQLQTLPELSTEELEEIKKKKEKEAIIKQTT